MYNGCLDTGAQQKATKTHARGSTKPRQGSTHGCWHRAHISLQRIHPHTIHWTLKFTICCAMALQAVVAEHMPAGVRNKWDQDFTGAADWAGAQWLEELSYTAATAAAATTIAADAAVANAAFAQLLLLFRLLLLRSRRPCWRVYFLCLLLQVSHRVLQAACCACMPTAAAAQHGQLG
jgi:hypothetical protein